MNANCAAILFDFDGTLVESSHGIFSAFACAAETLKLKIPDYPEFRTLIGPPILQIAKTVYPHLSATQISALISSFRSHYDDEHYQHTIWYESVLSTLDALNKYVELSLNVVTNKPTAITNKIIALANHQLTFDCVIGSDYLVDSANGDPFANKSQAIKFFLENRQLAAHEVLYVGDTPSDYNSCQECKIDFVAATYGFHAWSPAELQGIRQIDHFDQLLRIIRRT